MQADPMDSQLQKIYELGQSLYRQGDFVPALKYLTQFCTMVDPCDGRYSEAIFSRLRILTEMNLQDDRLRLETELLKSCMGLPSTGLATFYYLKGYNFLSEQKLNLSSEYFEKSLDEAVKTDSRVMMVQALFGCIFVALHPGHEDSELDAKIKKLDLLLSDLNRPDLVVSVLALKADVCLRDRDFVKAIHFAWEAYDKVKFTKNNFLTLSIIAKLGHVYLLAKKYEEAKIYLVLANRSLDASIYQRLSAGVQSLLNQLPEEASKKYDLILDEKNHLIIEKDKGPIDMKNQFILMDLLKLLMSNPGVPVSKEQLVDQIWHQKYDPKLHDNSIYVTIKRIRNLIEPNPQSSVYILRNRNGYLFSQDKKIRITTKETLQ